MKYILLDTNAYNGTQKGVNTLTSVQIKSGQHKGKFATSENSLLEFPEIFENLEYEIVELDVMDFQIDYSPPTLIGYGVEIPNQFIWVFPEDKFILNGFEIPLTNGAVDVAYFQWQEFRDELDSGNHEYLKRALMPLWDYVAEQVTNENLIPL
jgi:hypothetical protein